MIPLLLLPGMMCDARLFAPQIVFFSQTRPVMVGFIGGHNSIEALAGDVLAQAPSKFALAGLSMGGIVAMEILRQAPERVCKLALMDTNPLAELQAVKLRRAPQIKAASSGALSQVMRDEMKPNYLAKNPQKTNLLELCMEMALDLGPDVFVNQSIALRDRADQKSILQGFKGDALVLCGRHDRLCPVERHELMHQLVPNSHLVIIENAGHLPSLEQPKETTSALADWLEI